MPRVCTICSHESRDEIEDAFIAGQAKRRIAAQYGVSEQALRRHLREHLPALLALASDAERTARADSLLDRVEALLSRADAELRRVEGTDNHAAIWRGFSEMRSALELVCEVTKELERAPTVNLHLTPEWVELRAVMVEALEPYPAARLALMQAVGSRLEGG